MITGTNLLSEDFRLKKAAEGFAALSAASPVFAKINSMTEKLLSDNSPENLLDAITLVDAVITTLGTTEVKGELEDLPDAGSPSVIVNAPYSQLSAVLGALTTSGGGQYNTIVNARNETPEIFNDYRVKPALVKGLGASYAELADTVADILKGMGKDIVPLLKRNFDPKGKKEMIRRLDIIETLCGAEENDFYLEQLENAEKDVRKALIYALRHDEKNIDKLIELTKTEKGKLKTTALAALMSFDSETSAAFFEEYSKKKPAEVVPLLGNASSEWTSGLAARLIDELLVDEKGNKVTLSQAADFRKVKLKSKTSFIELQEALWGKTGADIERFYREFDNKDQIVYLDTRLGESILATNDEGLKALAPELNAAPKTKGGYVFAETVTRLLGKEDSSKWLAERIREEYKLHGKEPRKFTNSSREPRAFTNSPMVRALRYITFENGRYYINGEKTDPIFEERSTVIPIEITQPLKGAVSDALIDCPCHEYDMLLRDWIDENDKEYCEKVGKYFCRRLVNYAETGSLDMYLWGGCIKKCGLWNVKDLAVDFFDNVKGKGYTIWVQNVLEYIPGDDDYKLGQARAIIELAPKKNFDSFDIERFKTWANEMYNKG